MGGPPNCQTADAIISDFSSGALTEINPRLPKRALLVRSPATVERRLPARDSTRIGEEHRTAADRSGEEIGDRSAWLPRAKQGLDAVVRSAIKGRGGMPPRGGMADHTDPEIRGAIVYMFNQGAGPAK